MTTNNKQKYRYIWLFILFPVLIVAQEIPFGRSSWGLNMGFNFALGTHIQRIGLNLQFFFVKSHLQSNTEIRCYLNSKNLGPKKSYAELVMSQGLVYSFGKREAFINPFFSSVSNQTGYKNAVAYSYNLYFNKIKTSQQTGIVGLYFGSVHLITENDILARPMLDRFRTAAILIQYQYEDKFQAAVNCTMWTGQYRTKQSTNRNDVSFDCYMDTLNGLYINQSHGLLSLQYKHSLPYSQNVQLNSGIDAEQVRNFIQNKVMHDALIAGRKKKPSKNCHMPMTDSDGKQYLYIPGQKIRRPHLYTNVYANAGLFY